MSSKESKEGFTVGKYPAVWRFIYSFNQHITASVPFTGEVETVGYQTAQETFDVVATTPELAKAAWQDRNGWRTIGQSTRDAESLGRAAIHLWNAEPRFICYVDAMIRASYD